MGAKNGNVARPASPRMQTVCIGSKSSDFPLLPFICKMEEAFELPVLFNGQNLLLPAQLQAWGYSHRILVRLKDQTLIFEPDEERNYRAVLSDPERTPDLQLVKAIVTTLESLFR